jgi:DNA-binding XRE family transcriptional regulator
VTLAVVVTHDEIVAVRDLLRTTISPLIGESRDDDPPFMLMVFTGLVNLFSRLARNRAEVTASEVQEMITAGREAEEWRLEDNGVDRFAPWRPTIMGVLDRLLDEYPDLDDEEDYEDPKGKVTSRQLRRARKLALEADYVITSEPHPPPGARWLQRNLIAVLDRAIDGNRDLPAREVREMYIALREAGEWRMENQGGTDKLAGERTYVMEVLDRLADELPDSTDGLPCPIEPLSIRIRDRRTLAKLTQEELAQRIGVDHMTVSRWENDAGREPTPKLRRKLADTLGGKPSDYTRDE